MPEAPEADAPESDAPESDAPALIDARIAALGDWRGEMLARLRALIREALPQAQETVKWRKPSNGMQGVPVWESEGILCTGDVYKTYVKLTFAHGAALPDPHGLFNAGLNGGTRRAIDLSRTGRLDPEAFKALMRAAAARNAAARRGGRGG